jgi:hypothetical protein
LKELHYGVAAAAAAASSSLEDQPPREKDLKEGIQMVQGMEHRH